MVTKDLNAQRHHILHLLELPLLLPKILDFFLATGEANLVIPVKNRRRFSSRRDFLSGARMIGRTEKILMKSIRFKPPNAADT